MGFDHVDRKYRPPQPIKLECIQCGATDDTVQSVPHYAFEASVPLCWFCRDATFAVP